MTPSPTPELSLIIPTFNERDNVEPLYSALESTLKGTSWNLIIVDDNSTDGTIEKLETLTSQHSNVEFIVRRHQRGLSSACIEGMNKSKSPILAVMDADLQHDHTILPQMLSELKSQNADLVIGSRYIEGGGTEGWNRIRKCISRFAIWLGSVVIHHEVQDSMSGFFMVRREFYSNVVNNLAGIGFKILLDMIAASPKETKIIEVPYTFKPRHAGKSKLGVTVMWDFIVLIGKNLFRKR